METLAILRCLLIINCFICKAGGVKCKSSSANVAKCDTTAECTNGYGCRGGKCCQIPNLCPVGKPKQTKSKEFINCEATKCPIKYKCMRNATYNYNVCCKDTTKLDIKLRFHDHSHMTVKIGDEWLLVWDPFWNKGAAKVACRQMGFNPKFAQNFGTVVYGFGNAIVTNLTCNGNEKNLNDCNFSEWKIEHVGSVREKYGYSLQNGVNIGCRRMKTRLVGGTDKFSGRVKVLYNNKWRKVCVHRDSQVYNSPREMAQVVCRALKRPRKYAREYTYSGLFGKDKSSKGVELSHCGGFTTPALFENCRMQEVDCAGDEYFDLGVACFDHEPGYHEYVQPKTLGYDVNYERNGGIIIVSDWFGPPYFSDIERHVICGGDTWTRSEAQVVCRQMGYDPNDAIVDKFPFLQCYGEGAHNDRVKIVMSDVNCTGHEHSLAECNFNQGENVTCPDELIAGVICGKLPVYLTEMSRSRGGVSTGNLWSSYATHPVCGTGWDDNDARVVCRQLGLPFENASAYLLDYATQDSPWLTNVNCKGDETHIGQCDFDLDITFKSATGNYFSGNMGYEGGCNDYELDNGYIDFEWDTNFCYGGSLAGVICK
ncbi:unnamed protein product [Owenia fusiformis]|uniref:Uncharacterized protein n=1 Tax=Owenia fusiformis TaxID=6347 RepID=A0A8J1UH31_OWEFU|nr:unnamed protein product [Owenia fusiformis]